MKVHYFYKRNYNKYWFAIQLEALMEEDSFSAQRQVKEKSFTYLEKLRCHICKDMGRFQSSEFNLEFGKDSCHGSGAKSVAELYKIKLDKTHKLESFTLITRLQYERLRKLAFAVYEKNKCMDFDMVKEKQNYSVTTIIE